MSENNILKTIYIIRHGETNFNKQNIVQGSGVDTDLNETGAGQAQAFFDRYQSHLFDKVYTSALKRSIQSVDGFLKKGLPHEALPELNEICWGDFEGKVQTEEQRLIYWDTVNRWKNGEFELAIANGESPLQMQERQKAALQKILLNEKEKNVLICMHGRAMKSMLCLLLDEPLSNMENFQHTNLCLYVLEYDGKNFRLLKGNDIEHLN